ncbi:MAG: LysR substrate-binding domain-containing protein [Pseudomonadota bacterium]|nr:LysR substrate-binding domain-containing protein [Pseudomonadota bacterium]
MARKLPPFAALRAFEAAARHLSLSKAADELRISPSAVSHQVKALEIFVGSKLLLRSGAGLRLTGSGTALVEGLGGALDVIETCTMRVMHHTEEGTLSVHLFQSLAQLWLIPHLSDFLGSNPDISVQLITKPDSLDPAVSLIDVDIRYATAPPSEPDFIKLFEEVIYPVVAPNYLKLVGPLDTPADLMGRRLIGCDYEPGEWEFWFRAIGVGETAARPQLMFDERAHSIQAAVEGLGVAMNRRPFGENLIRQGVLLAPFSERIRTEAAYYLIVSPRAASLPRVKRFTAWLSTICAGMRAA